MFAKGIRRLILLTVLAGLCTWARAGQGKEQTFQRATRTNETEIAVKVRVQGFPDTILPLQFELKQNYPNPFNSSTVISYSLSARAHTTLEVFNGLGRRVDLLVNQNQEAGRYRLYWSRPDLPSGTFFYRLRAGQFEQTRMMQLVK